MKSFSGSVLLTLATLSAFLQCGRSIPFESSGVHSNAIRSTNTASPLEIAQAFLAGIKTRDTEGMLALCHENVTGCLIRNGQPVYVHMADVIESIGNVPTDIYYEEVPYDEVVQIDGDFATVWTPYLFYTPTEGNLYSEGSNSFTLWKSPERGWIITTISDISRNL